jgi:hypothetical protein
MTKEFGKKAESLLFLKEKGFFNSPLLILKKLPRIEEFKDILKLEGFKDGEELAVRFSSSDVCNLPRSIILESFEQVYKFVQENIQEGIFPIIHKFFMPAFSGTLLKLNNEIKIDLINGAWEPDSANNCDFLIIKDEAAKIYFLDKEKECLFVNKNKLERRKIKNSKEEIIEIFKIILSKLETFNFEQGFLYEFIITPERDFVIMEFKDFKQDKANYNLNQLDLHEISEVKDLESWNKKKDILLSMIVERENELDFFKVIEKIKKHKDKVYVNYGLCSHPCIILREFGITPILYLSEHYEINLDI